MRIDGKEYKVIENLGFVHRNGGEYAKVVFTDDGDKIVTKSLYRGAKWKFAKPIINIIQRELY